MTNKQYKIYIAGPGVFHAEANMLGERYKRYVQESGHIPLWQLDSDASDAKGIFDSNKKKIDSCDIVIADLNNFRGSEPDSGTVWECGYAYGKGKVVVGYSNFDHTYKMKVYQERIKNSNGYDKNNYLIEDFGLSYNLMIAQSLHYNIYGNFKDALTFITKAVSVAQILVDLGLKL